MAHAPSELPPARSIRIPLFPAVARRHNSKKSFRHFSKRTTDPEESVALPQRPQRSAGGDSRGTALFRADERGLTMSLKIPIPRPKTPAPTDRPRSHLGPQPSQEQPLPRAARRHGRAHLLSVFNPHASVVPPSPSCPLVALRGFTKRTHSDFPSHPLRAPFAPMPSSIPFAAPPTCATTKRTHRPLDPPSSLLRPSMTLWFILIRVHLRSSAIPTCSLAPPPFPPSRNTIPYS